jgi:hypothetical protein
MQTAIFCQHAIDLDIEQCMLILDTVHKNEPAFESEVLGGLIDQLNRHHTYPIHCLNNYMFNLPKAMNCCNAVWEMMTLQQGEVTGSPNEM